ncbi:hypothetical protein M3699_05665 [Peribacillus simplex]|uniref:right-handed parallel beta-helix repeat-containing protein n=1 Tax=Peribacillus simplex TaxID=1478 RepID=UPI00203FDDA2|nr:right-handed parallel beta-helix repeat-containing protein [Peribacillus simplex]MCM3673373.1 hypothetical protein [Peribacillus simplex]
MIVLYVDAWGLTELDELGTNANEINRRLADLDSTICYELIVNKLYNISSQLNILGKKIRLVGQGGFKAITYGMTMIKVTNCPDILFKNILFDGGGLARNGIDIENSPRFSFDNVRIQNIGNTTLNNVHGIFISHGNDGGISYCLKVQNIISSSSSSGVAIDNVRDNTRFSKSLLFQKCEIINIQPSSDADGIKVLQISHESDITIESSRFIKCAKRGIKAQSKKVFSRNNYIEDSYFAAIDFQSGEGVSENDRVFITEGFTADQLIALSGNDNEVRGLRANVLSINQQETSGIVVSGLAGSMVNKVKLENVEIKGTRYPIQLFPEIAIGELSISRSVFSGFSGSYVIPSPKPSAITKIHLDGNVAIPATTYYGFIHGDIGRATKYMLINNDVGTLLFGSAFARTEGTIRGNIGHLFEEEKGIRKYYTNTIPSATNSAIYHYAKKGDVAINTNIAELGVAGMKYIIKRWICIADGNYSTSNKGTWIEDRILTGA